MLGMKNRKSIDRENYRAVKPRKARNQQLVLEAVKELGKPSNGRAVARHLGWDSASVTNRLAELTKKNKIHIAYRKKGLDGLWRNYYVVTR